MNTYRIDFIDGAGNKDYTIERAESIILVCEKFTIAFPGCKIIAVYLG